MRIVLSSVVVVASLVMDGCARTPLHPHVFEPSGASETYPYYVLGTPYAAVSCPCADIRMSLSTVTIFNTRYLRAFIFYENTSEVPFLFCPLDSMALCIEDKGESKTVPPSSPSAMLRQIEKSTNAAIFVQALAGGLEAAAVRPTTVSGPRGSYRIDDTAFQQQLIADRTARDIAITAAAGEVTGGAVSSTVLQRHTIFPGSALAGFAYFAARGQTGPWMDTADALAKYIASHRFALTIHTPCGVRTVEFVPAPGE